MTWFLLLLLAADSPGQFDERGRRLEEARAMAQLSPEQEAGFRTIAEWEEMALSARSKLRRNEGATAVFRLSLHRHKTPLSDAELLAAQQGIFKLLAAPDAEVRRQAARTLGRLGFLSSAEALRERAGKDEDPFVRAACYASLGELKDKAAIELLAKAVAKEGPTPACEAAGALEAIGTAEARAALEELSKRKLHETVLEVVNQALDAFEFGK